MDEQKRMLATAWRDLAGGAEGMVYMAELGPGPLNRHVMDAESARRASVSTAWLPGPDAPPNWGVWLAWMEKHLPGLRLGRDDMAAAWTATVDGIQHRGTPGAALMGLMCRWYEDRDVLVSPEYVPPSVTAWWKAQQTSPIPGA